MMMRERYGQVGGRGVFYQHRIAGIGFFDLQPVAGEKRLQPFQQRQPYMLRLGFGIGLQDLLDAVTDLIPVKPCIIRRQGRYEFFIHPRLCMKWNRIKIYKTPVSVRSIDRTLTGVLYILILFHTESRVNEKFISTLATNDAEFDRNKICYGVQRILQTDPESQSQHVRLALLERLQPFFPGDRLQIEKADAGYPVLVKNSSPTNLPISFSHHHNLVFYSFIL